MNQPVSLVTEAQQAADIAAAQLQPQAQPQVPYQADAHVHTHPHLQPGTAQVQQFTQVPQEPGTFSIDDQDFGDIADPLQDVTDLDTEVKSSSDFQVVFRKEVGGKKIKGQGDAAETICTVGFSRSLAGQTDAEEAPKKRGRKSDAERAAGAKASTLRITFWDDTENIAVSFIEKLAEREDFAVEVISVDEDQTPLETFTFEGCNIKADCNQYHEFNNGKPGDPRTLHLVLSYSAMTRANAEEQDQDE